jgi:hypothetical protein
MNARLSIRRILLTRLQAYQIYHGWAYNLRASPLKIILEGKFHTSLE